MTLGRERPPNLLAKRVMEAWLSAILEEEEEEWEWEWWEIISTSLLEATDMGESAMPGGGREEEDEVVGFEVDGLEEGLRSLSSSKRESTSDDSESRSIGTTAPEELSIPRRVTERPAEDEVRLRLDPPPAKEAGEADLELMSGRFRGGGWPSPVATEEDREELLGGKGGL